MTGDPKLWPPGTNGMSLDELVKLRRIANETLEHLKPIIVKECTQVGHVWNKVSGVQKTEKQYVMGGFSGISDDYDEGVPDKTFYVRTCKRCGVVQKEEEYTTTHSPFEVTT